MLLAVNGQTVTTTYDVSAAKDGLKVGDTVTLTIYRDGKRSTSTSSSSIRTTSLNLLVSPSSYSPLY